MFLRSFFSFLLLWMTTANAEYVFTMPRIMTVGRDSKACISVKTDDRFSFGIEVEITYDEITYNDDITKKPEGANKYLWQPTDFDDLPCKQIRPPFSKGRYNATIVGTYWELRGSDNYAKVVFEQYQPVDAEELDLIQLIQTDKPIYKPGETVKFRVMTMDYMLMAQTDGYDQITIESPNGNRVMQWDDVDTVNGLVSLEMPLSSEPILGSWLIKVKSTVETSQNFKVDEYVLPKYEVTVTPPKYLLPTTPKITGEVCAKYTYGKPVKGSLKMEVCFTSGYTYHYSYYSERPCHVIFAQIDGCYTFYVDSELIKLGRKGHTSWGQLRINATVTEDATGIELLGQSEGPGLSMTVLNLRLEDDSSNYFKPGFPYKGRVVVTNPDGSPAIGEEIEVNGRDYWGSDYFWTQKILSDENGIVNFAVSEISTSFGRLSLTATAVQYETDWRYYDHSDGDYFRTYSPQAYATLTKWFSPSDSYIFIPDVEDKVDCDSQLELDVFYSTQYDSDDSFQVIMKAGDNIVHTQRQESMYDGSQDYLDLLMKDIDPSSVLVRTLRTTPAPTSPLPTPPLPEIYYEEGEAEVDPELLPVIEDIIVPEVVQPLGQSRVKRESPLIEPKIGHFQLSVPVTQAMSPDVQVLVYYMREDREIVASSVKVQVKSCFKNKVKMSFSEDTVHPGETLTLNLEASSQSTCFVGMVDKSVNLIGGKNQLTPSELFERVRSVSRPYRWVGYWQEDREYCDKVNPHTEDEENTDYGFYWSYSNPEGVDAIQAFREANMIVITDGVLETRPCSDRQLERRFPEPMYMMSGSGPSGGIGDRGEISASMSPKTIKIRSFFPETWLWDMFTIGDDGHLSKQTIIPDTITEWVGNSLCTHPVDGVGVTELTGVTAFQPFFVSLTLPYSAIRGEKIPILVTVFNYLENCLTMELSLAEPEGYEVTSGMSKQFCLCGGDTETTKFHIIPTIIGEIDITATAVSVADSGLCKNVILSDEAIGVSDGVQKQLLIEAEGVPQDMTESFYMCANGVTPIQEKIALTLPDGHVHDSERATVSVVGDIMGPTLSNLKNLLRMPYGCGEQNMASWSPNIYVLQYLSNTNQLTETIENEAKGYMRVGYQRQMKYRHNDNSYSAFGENSHGNATGSLWLTAFVVKSMAESAPFITIDSVDMEKSIEWMLSHQMENGCFPRVGKVFGSYMKGGLGGEENPAGLTAFVTIAIIEASKHLENNDEYLVSITRGLNCVLQYPLTDSDTYTLSLLSFFFTEADSKPDQLRAMTELEKRKKTSAGLEHWSRENVEQPDKKNGWWYRAPSAEVEMTAYVLMAILDEGTDALGRASPIIQWLTRQRNPYGGFSSTQDTVVALQALSRFAALTYSGQTDVTVEVKNEKTEHVFMVTPDNTLLYQSAAVDIAKQGGYVDITTTGSGCAMVQVNMKYNVYEEEHTGPAFDLKVSIHRVNVRNQCKYRNIEICVSYLKPGGPSNMAIVEVKLPTGWSRNADAKDLELMTELDRIQKFEVDNNFIELYFDEFTGDRRCMLVQVQQDIVMKTLGGMVRVYDYYETEFSVTSTYNISTTCGTKEEIPLDNAGLDCSIMQCRVDDTKRRESCPECPEAKLSQEQFESLTCDSAAVYKGIVGRSGQYPAKIKADIRNTKKQKLDKFVSYNLPKSCTCDVLNNLKDGRVIMFSKTTTAIRKDGSETIRLDKDITIVKQTKKIELAVRRLASKEHLCQKLARLRRSGSKKSNRLLSKIRKRLLV